jgi:hypothetical protein
MKYHYFSWPGPSRESREGCCWFYQEFLSVCQVVCQVFANFYRSIAAARVPRAVKLTAKVFRVLLRYSPMRKMRRTRPRISRAVPD